MKAFVAGATGQTGRRIVQELVNHQIPVRALVRNLESGRQILPPNVEIVVGDVLNPQSLKDAIGDSTILFCASGVRPSFDPFGPYRVDYEGTKNLVKVAKEKDIKHFVLVSSLCLSQLFHPLNLFWLILFWKKQAEVYLQNSGLIYTIVRPGGLKNEETTGAIIMQSADTLFNGSIPRTKVAQVCVASLFEPGAQNKIVEIIADADAPVKSFEQLFNGVS